MRLPIGATLLTLAMVPVLILLGLWQLERREWKHAMIAELQRAPSLPPVAPREFFASMVSEKSLQFRRAEVDCRPGRVTPYDLKGGTSATGEGGYLVLVACRAGARPDLVVVAGWTARPDAIKSLVVDTSFSGTVIERPYGKALGRPRFMLIPATAVPPLLPSRLPTVDDLPDSHLSYAMQWFAFAATLSVIYVVYVRRWRRGT